MASHIRSELDKEGEMGMRGVQIIPKGFGDAIAFILLNGLI